MWWLFTALLFMVNKEPVQILDSDHHIEYVSKAQCELVGKQLEVFGTATLNDKWVWNYQCIEVLGVTEEGIPLMPKGSEI